MNAATEQQSHGPDCECGDDRCLDARHDALLVQSAALMIADYLAMRALTYPTFSAERMAVQADADAVRRGAWRKR